MSDEPPSDRVPRPPCRPRFRSPRAAVALLLLALALSCSLRDPSGTRWSTTLSLVTQAETLRVSRALENPAAALGPDSLLLFRQELDTVWARFRDSLLWRGAHATLSWSLGRLDLHGLGSGDAELPFVAAWPQYAGLVGQNTRIVGEDDCDVLVPLPPWPDMEWMAFSGADFDLAVQHAWPFPLQWLELDLVNAQGLSLGGRRIEPAGGIAPNQPRSDELHVAGLVSRDCRVRVRAHHLPMPAAALIQSLLLELTLTQTAGSADSARAVIPAQDFVWTDSLESMAGLRILRAESSPLLLSLRGENSTPLGLEISLSLPQLSRLPGGNTLQLSQQLSPGASIQRDEDLGPVLLEDPDGLRQIHVEAEGHSSAGAGLVTVRARDRVELELAFAETRLRQFDGWFSEDLIVPLESSETEVDTWPAELVALDLEGLELRLHLSNNTSLALSSLILLGVDSGVEGQADTTYILQPALQARDSLVTFTGMGSLAARLPRAVNVAGSLRVPAGTRVELDEESRIGVGALSVPGRGRLRELAWRSLPEIHRDQVPEEAGQIRLLGMIENRLPAGGRVQGRVATDLVGADPVPLFDLHVSGGQWHNGTVGAAFDTLSLELSDEAIDVMRRPEWVLWYEFAADDPGEEVEIRADQWLRVQSLIQVEVDIHAGEN